MKRILTATIVILGLCVSSVSVIAEPVVEDVTIDPEEPEPLDTVTITATITSEDDIEEVTLKIKECKADLCWTPVTYDMILDNGNYTATHELEYAAATYFGYSFIITSNGNITETEFVNVTLKLDSGNGDTNGGDEDGGIPGFELVPLLVAILIGVLLLRRKRSR